MPKRNSILDPFGLAPGASTTKSATAMSATSTAGAGGLLNSLLEPAQGVLGALGSVFDGIVANLTTDLDNGLTNLENGLAANITKQLGLQQYYSLYVNGICMGSFRNGTYPNSAGNSTRCMTYSNATSGMFRPRTLADLNGFRTDPYSPGLSNFSIPNSIKLGTTNVSVPILASVSGAGGTVTGAVTVLTKAIFAFVIISLVGSSVTVIGSVVGFLLPWNSMAVYSSMGFSALGFIFHLAGATISTAVIAALNLAASSIGNGVGVYSTQGTKFLIFVWLSSALLLISTFYWVSIWFVEFREFALRVRRRSSDEIGNWRGLRREIWGDLRAESVLLHGKRSYH
jgi:SUR7/PalI family